MVTKKELIETILVIIIFLTSLSVTIQRREESLQFFWFLSSVHCISSRTVYTERTYQQPQRVSPCPIVVPIFFFVFSRLVTRCSAVFCCTGVESSRIRSCVTCVTGVEDVLAVELEDPVDKPRRTIGTQFSVLHRIFLPLFYKRWLLTTGPLVGLFVIFGEFSKR